MVRDAFPWKQHMISPRKRRRAVEGRTINHYLKSAALSMSVGVMTSSCFMTQVFIFELTTCPEIKGFHGDVSNQLEESIFIVLNER